MKYSCNTEPTNLSQFNLFSDTFCNQESIRFDFYLHACILRFSTKCNQNQNMSSDFFFDPFLPSTAVIKNYFFYLFFSNSKVPQALKLRGHMRKHHIMLSTPMFAHYFH